MECREAMQYLFVYAKGILKEEKRAAVQAHLDGCAHCRDMAAALGRLIPQMPPEDEEVMCHWNIEFPEEKLEYGLVGFRVENPDWCNDRLREWGGEIPEAYDWFGSGFDDVIEPGPEFDNAGNEIGYAVSRTPDGNMRRRTTRLTKVYPYMRMYSTKWIKAGCWDGITVNENGVYSGSMHNCFGQPVKTGLYQMIPKTAKNIRIQRGSGICDCGEYLAVYAARYTGEGETIHLDYTFTL